MIIAPSLLSADFSRLKDEIQAVEEAGADWIHIDVMDGHFVPNLTMGPPVVNCIRKVTQLPLDVHLMIENPQDYVQPFRDAGADTISVHAEATPHLQKVLHQIRESGASPAVALNPSTSLYVLDYVWDDIDMILCMSVNPGFGGQNFIPGTVNKIQTLRKKLERHAPKVKIEVDGGIGVENIAKVAKAGASIFVAGSAIFRSADYKKTIHLMRDATKS